MPKPLLDCIVERRKLLICVGLLMSLGFGFIALNLKLDHKLVDLFAESDPVLEPYRRLQSTFGENEIVLAVFAEPELTKSAGQERIAKLTERVREIEGIVGAVSIVDLPAATNFEDQNRGARFRRVFQGYTHNNDHDIAGVICLLQQTEDVDAHRKTLDSLREVVTSMPEGTLVGETVILREAFDLLEDDGRRLNTWCTLLLLGVVYVCFRQWRWLVLTLLVVQMTLALTRGVLVLAGLQLTMVSSMLAAIVTVVSVAMVIHVIVRYREGLGMKLSPQESLERAMNILGWPILFACLTDAAGFAALLVSEVGPIRDFGLMMALGSLLVLVSGALAVPAIVLFGNQRLAPDTRQTNSALQSKLTGLLHWATGRARRLYLIGGIVTAIAVIGCPLLEVETDFTRNFHEQSDLLSGYEYVEENFGGAGVWDILVPVDQRFDKDFLLKVLELERQLVERVPNVSSAISIADAIDAGTAGLDQLDLLAQAAVSSSVGLMRGRMPEFVEAIYEPGFETDSSTLRIMLRSPERLQSEEKIKVIDEVSAVTEDVFPKAEVTGYYVLLTNLIESLLGDQWKTFGVAAIAILAMMAIAFGSVRLAVVTLIPNVLPVLWLFGAMGLLGVRLNMGAAMIAAVSLGLSVDGSIHYVTSYLRERRAGASISEALQRVQSTVGLAAVLATLALVVGFATLCISEFLPTVYFGMLVSLSMIGGLVGNLVVLPLLIQWVDSDNNRPFGEPHLGTHDPKLATINSPPHRASACTSAD